MDIAFTTPNDLDTAHDTVCVLSNTVAPHKGDIVEIDDLIYEVTSVEWHIRAHDVDDQDYPVAELYDVIVRLSEGKEA